MSIAKARSHLRKAKGYTHALVDGLMSGPQPTLQRLLGELDGALLELDGPLLSEAVPVTVEQRERAKATVLP